MENNRLQSFKTPKWAIVDKNGKVIEKYRNKASAITNISRLKRIYIGSKLVITKINNTKTINLNS